MDMLWTRYGHVMNTLCPGKGRTQVADGHYHVDFVHPPPGAVPASWERKEKARGRSPSLVENS